MVVPVTAEQLEEKIYEILTTEDASNLSKKKVRALLSQCFGAALEVKKRKQEIKEITMKVVRKIQSDHAQGAVEPAAKTNPVEPPKKPPSPKPVPPPVTKPVEAKKQTPKSYTDLEVSTRTKKLLKSLTTAQLQQLSIKAVRKMLEEQLGVSLKPQKKVVKLSVEMFTEDLQRKMKQEQKKKRKREEVKPAIEPEGKPVKKAKVLPTEQQTVPKSTKKRKQLAGSEGIQSTKENEPIRLKKRKLRKRQEQEDDQGKKKSKEINVKTEIKSQQLAQKQSIPDIKSKVVAKKLAHRENVNQKSKSSTDKPKKIRPSGLQRAKKKLPKTIEPAKPIEPNVKKEEEKEKKEEQKDKKEEQKDKKEEQKEKKEEQKDEKKEICEIKQTSEEKNKVKSYIPKLNETKEVIAEKKQPKESDKDELQKKTEVTCEEDQPQKPDKNIRPERKDEKPEVKQPQESDKDILQEANAETLEKAQLEIADKDKVAEEKDGKPEKEKSQKPLEEKLQKKTEQIPEKEPSQVEKTIVVVQTSTNENSEQAGDKIQTKVQGEKAEEEKITTLGVNAVTDKEDVGAREIAESKDNQSKQDTLPTTATIEVSPSIIEEKDAIDIASNKEQTQSVKLTDGDNSKTEVPAEEVQESSPPLYLEEELTNVVSLDELLRTEDWTMKTVFESAKAELRKSSVEDVAEKAFKVVQSRFGEKSSTLPAALYPLLVKYKLDANWPIPPRMEPFIFSVYSSCSVDFLTYLRVHGVPEVAKDDENRTILHLVSYSLARASHNGENDDMWAVLELLKSGGFSFDESANELGSAMDILKKYGTADAVSRAKALVT